MLPLKVALPFSWTGNSSGPRTAARKGIQSATLVVETERRTADLDDSVPEAWSRDVGELRVKRGRSSVSLDAWKRPSVWAVSGS